MRTLFTSLNYPVVGRAILPTPQDISSIVGWATRTAQPIGAKCENANIFHRLLVLLQISLRPHDARNPYYVQVIFITYNQALTYVVLVFSVL